MRALRAALVSLWRSPAFAAFAMASITVGVGASSAVFSLAEQALYRELPVRAPERLALLSWQGYFVGDGWGSGDLASYPLYQELRETNEVFETVFARHPASVHFADGEAAENVPAEIVTGTYFPALGVQPALGRLLTPADDERPDAHPVMVISFDFWRNRLAGDPDVVGRQVTINGGPMTVLGVAPAGFYGMDWAAPAAVWIPTMMKRQATPSWDRLFDRRSRWLHVFGRLQPGVTLEQAEASIQPWFKAMLAADTEREGWPPVEDNIKRQFLDSTLAVLPGGRGRSDARQRSEAPFLVLFGATCLVLLLACLNVANLSLARALGRERAVALRAAIGATRGRIAGETLLENALLALGGGLLGLLLAPQLTHALLAFLSRNVAGVMLSADLNSRVMTFALAASTLTALASGFAPALASSRVGPMAALKAQAATLAGGLRLRRALVVGQIGLALILLICAGLFMRTLASLRSQGPGFDTAELMTFHLDFLKNGYTRAEAEGALRRVLDELRASPEVGGAGASWIPLLAGDGWNQRLMLGAEPVRAACNAVTPGYFGTLGVPMVAGRDFDERDASPVGASGWRSAIVNERFAKKFLGDRNPIGAWLGFGSTPQTPRNIEIVGVVRDFRYTGLREDSDQIFVPMFEAEGGWATFYARGRHGSARTAAAIRAAVRKVDAAAPVNALRSVDQQMDRSLSIERLLAWLAGCFGAAATFLAVLGLYGVTAFSAARRTREIGVRLALGASRRSAEGLIVGEAARLVAWGALFALPIAALAGRLIESQLHGVRAIDIPTMAAALTLVATASLLAAAAPARRAAARNPTESLRSE